MFGFLAARRKRKAAREKVRELLAEFSAATDAGEGRRTLDGLREVASTGDLPELEMHAAYGAAYQLYADASIRDDLINADETAVLSGIWDELGTLRPGDVEDGKLLRASSRVLACLINTHGPLPVASSLGGREETVYWQGHVDLMRQKKSFRGHSPSISVPLGRGVRFRWSVFEGAPSYSSDYSAVDSGSFAVTAHELIFLGGRSTIKTALHDVLQIDLLGDGFRVHSSRRERVDMFRTTEAPVAAATIQWLLAHEGPA